MPRREIWRPADTRDTKVGSGPGERLARFVLGALQNQGYDSLRRSLQVDGRKAVGVSTIKDFARDNDILYQSLWATIRGVTTPKDEFLVSLAGKLGFEGKDEISLILLIAHQARMPEDHRDILEPLISELAHRTGLAPLVHGLA